MVFERQAATDGLSRGALSALVVAARAVNGATALRETLETILDEALDLLAADEGSVMLLDGDGTGLYVAAGIGIPPEEVSSIRVPVGTGIAGYVAASGQPLLLGDQDPRSEWIRGRNLRSSASVPMVVGGQVVGVLNVNLLQDNDREDLSEHDVELATLFAEFAAAAVRNAQLYDQARQRRDQLARLLEASHALSNAVEPQVVADRILTAGGDLIDSIGGIVFAVTPDGSMQVVGRDRIPRGLARSVRHREELHSLMHGDSVSVVEEVADHPALAPLGRWGRTAVVAPLQTGSADRGLVVTLVPRPPSATVLDTWSTYTHHAAFALVRAVLFRHVRVREDSLRSLVAAVPDPFLVVDADDRFMAINPAAAEVLGLNPEFDVGLRASDRLRSPELSALLAEPDGGHAEVRVELPRPRILRARSVPVRPDGAELVGRILSLEDVTAARETEQLKSDFVAVVGHELRTPLTLIRGYSATLAKRGESLDSAARQRALSALNDQTTRLQRLIEDLLLVARVERNRPPLHLTEQDVRDVVRATAAQALDLHPDHNFDFDLPDQAVVVPVDPVKMQQILHHLIDNACKFSDPDTAVTIEVEGVDDGVEVRVCDEGIGIFSGDVQTLFERFQQLDGTATREHGGTGVGLYIAKTLVDAHGGTIGVRSALGRGSTFWFRLPANVPDAPEERLPGSQTG